MLKVIGAVVMTAITVLGVRAIDEKMGTTGGLEIAILFYVILIYVNALFGRRSS